MFGNPILARLATRQSAPQICECATMHAIRGRFSLETYTLRCKNSGTKMGSGLGRCGFSQKRCQAARRTPGSRRDTRARSKGC